jgi:hypothetical protein
VDLIDIVKEDMLNNIYERDCGVLKTSTATKDAPGDRGLPQETDNYAGDKRQQGIQKVENTRDNADDVDEDKKKMSGDVSVGSAGDNIFMQNITITRPTTASC